MDEQVRRLLRKSISGRTAIGEQCVQIGRVHITSCAVWFQHDRQRVVQVVSAQIGIRPSCLPVMVIMSTPFLSDAHSLLRIHQRMSDFDDLVSAAHDLLFKRDGNVVPQLRLDLLSCLQSNLFLDLLVQE